MSSDRDDLERAVRQEWCTVLDIHRSEPEDDFFELGGNSMQAARLVKRLENRLGIEFPLEALFIEGTLQAVVTACGTSAPAARPESGAAR
ncbi:phosphopantetheine-binding protein [Streptomyces enissocaesilis]|uniref:Carrier domain-containing protein n=1 Tax=Streptomyces enissocaesilis TaxID=332589 RepID=A0ABN3X9B0_9ACTN